MPTTATPLVEAERNDLAEFLETLTPQQWAARSLCEDWTVRDVVAHVVSYEGAGAVELLRRFTQGRFLLNRINGVSLDQQREREPDELVALLREHLTPRGLTAAFGGRIALVDTLVHHQASGQRSACRATCQPNGFRWRCPSPSSHHRSRRCGMSEAWRSSPPTLTGRAELAPRHAERESPS